MRRTLTALVASGAVALVPLAVSAAPTCTGTTPQAACGNRVVAEPLQTATFLQYTEAMPALEAIEALAPEIIELSTLSELVGPEFVSAGGREIPVVRLTDESVKGPKKRVAIALSLHGQESAGREGGTRYLEDVARWWAADDRDHPLYAGDVEAKLGDVLKATETWIGYLNPDGWAAGDIGSSEGAPKRANDNGTDLNREFPTVGWTNRNATPLSDPEAIGWVKLLKPMAPFTTASDIHGELTSDNNAFADLMYPAGQWDAKRQRQHEQLGQHAIRSIERKFAEHGVVLDALTPLAGTPAEAVPIAMKPASAATGYDVVGYDDGGFLGDWFDQGLGAVDLDAENFLSHLAPGNVWIGALEQAHVAAVRGLMEAVIVEATLTGAVKPSLDFGRIGYVFDPARVTSKDGPGVAPDEGVQKPYDVSRMDYFADLRKYVKTPIVPLSPADLATGKVNLSAYDSLVVVDEPYSRDAKGRSYNRDLYVAALDRFAKAGGQLVLTDKAATLLGELGFEDEGALQEIKTNAGHVDFGALDHPWEQDLSSTASQTYYEVPLGFSPLAEAPHYGVTTAAWEEAGGTTVGTVGEDGAEGPAPGSGVGEGESFTVLGELPHGEGRIAMFGAVLPQPTEENEHAEGLVDYGVTIAGGQVLHRILGFKRPGAPAVAPAPEPAPAPAVPTAAPRPTPPAPLPATGGPLTLALVGTAAVAGALQLRRRRAG